MGVAPEPESQAWDALTGSLGLAGATTGQRRSTPAGVPPLAGLVEGISEGQHMHSMLLRLDEPAPGIVSLGAFTCGGPVMVGISFYLYGDRAPTVVARDEPLWQAWMNERFPSAGDVSSVA